ncbi:MAG: NUDIX hydrolase [Gammaproteobacteria bacterium]
MARPQTPLLTVDVVIESTMAGDASVVLVKRANPPLGWALPGGFVDVGETVESAARREVLEETGLAVSGLNLLGVYSDPARDPRGHTASIVFIAQSDGIPLAGDDAAEARWFSLKSLPGLVFDHAHILRDYQTRQGLAQA